MKKVIELTIEHKSHTEVELTNGKGDTFTYNPQKHEGFEDFLSGAKICTIHSVSNWLSIDDNQDLYVKTVEENPRTEIMFDDGSIVRYFEEWPFAEATDFRIK